MKITEIEYGHWNKPSLSVTAIIPANKIGSFDGLDVHQFKSNGQIYFLVLNSDGTYRGYISVSPEFSFNEAYVTDKNRRNGICSSLVLFVLRTLHKKLTLGYNEIITDDSRQLFYQLAKTNKITITNNGNTVDVDALGKIFADISDNDLVLVIEGQQKRQSLTCNELIDPLTGLAIIESTAFGPTTRDTQWYD